jgi:hypothetical protein
VQVRCKQNELRTVSDKCEDHGILSIGAEYLDTNIAASMCTANEESLGRTLGGQNMELA